MRGLASYAHRTATCGPSEGEGEDHGAIATRCSRLIAAVGPLAVGRLGPVARARGGTARLFRANDRRNMASAL